MAGGVTQLLPPEKVIEGMEIFLAAVTEDGFVTAAAMVANAVIVESYFTARNAEPPPMEWPITQEVAAIAPKKLDEGFVFSDLIAPIKKAMSFPKSECDGEKEDSVVRKTIINP